MMDLKPTATGTLSGTPLPNLLAYLLDRTLTGTLVIEDPSGSKSALSFESGHPMRVRTPESVILLGELLVELGLLDRANAERAAEQALAARMLYGAHLVASDVLSSESMEEALREQFRQRVRWMFSLPPSSVYGFYESLNLLEQVAAYQGPPVAVLPLVWQGIREHAAEERVQAVLERLGTTSLRLHSEAQLGRFEFDRNEQALADVLRAKPQSLQALILTRLVEERIARRMVYLLAITRHLELGTGGRPIGVDVGASRRSRTPTTVRSSFSGEMPNPPSARSVHELHRRVADLRNRDLYQVLQVDRKASMVAVQSAFVRLVKEWHPDRVGPASDEARQLANQAFTRLCEAHAVLTDPDARRKYDEALAEGVGEDEREHVGRVLRGAVAFQRAEILYRKNHLEAAEQEAKQAMEADPEQADYLALYAWISAQKPDRIAGGLYEDLIALLSRAIKLAPENERARFWRGQLLQRAGRVDEAHRDFRWVVHYNPRHVDAARELRLYDMRRGSDRPERSSTPPPGRATPQPARPADAGLLGKLFKR